MPYRFLDKIAIADSAFEVDAESVEELFCLCAEATFQVMVDLATVVASETRTVILKAPTVDHLLYDWLAELIYLKDRDSIVFTRFEVSVQQNGEWQIEAKAHGKTIDRQLHHLRTDVKAVTYHQYQVTRSERGWYARIVLDT